uniref:Uncharacterized protein n=1 Tax=Chromera velia CCMP2878 TaxID=1169474 RepID=A0A0G4FS90_9ALVE|eukprot:Cvel_18361.t1-p1 / transcript=Cvel_18361.t1 / gene=Cvel_18361 / organism=Chromera_velia_CCMP2878 / gene_product=Zinc finger protein 283, putative / transcript_product=Zinc finger protein 283, putative / location=Cvel_scaffold1516:39563-44887(-) / protein_length=516 / sequence_SO=supercontig / SO=protein_coding / is_pseudo=false
MIGISVEWGVPESVQLGLIPVQTNRETEQHSHREDEHRFPSGRESERVSPTDSHEEIQRDSRKFHSTDERENTSEVPICSFQSAAEFRGPDSQTERDAGSHGVRESERGRMQPEEDDMCSPRLNSSGVCSRPFVDAQTGSRKRPSTNAQTDNRVLPSHKPTSTHLPPHECDRDRQKEEGGQRGQVISLKRRRSESALPHDDAAECNRTQVGDCAGGRGGYSLQGSDECVLREEKQRRLSVSVSDSAPLTSEGKAVAFKKFQDDYRGEEGEEGKGNRHAQILCFHGQVGAFVSTAAFAHIARSVEGRAFVVTVDSALSARIAEARASVSTAGSAHVARIAAGRAYVSTAAFGHVAKSAEVGASVSTAAFAHVAKSAEVGASVNTADNDTRARSVEGRGFVSTAGSALSAKSAGGRAFVSTVVFALTAKSAEVRASVSTADSALDARSVEGRSFVSTVDGALSVKSAEVRASVTTVDGAHVGKSAERRASVSTDNEDRRALNTECRTTDANRQGNASS